MPLDYGFVQQLKNHMNHLKPLSTSTHGFSKIFVHPKLDDCSHVFLRVDKVSPSLSQPYTGPHEVLSRNDKHITININGKKSCVSLDRVKPAFVFKDLPDTIPDPIISAESSHRHPVTTNMQTTKSGRREFQSTVQQIYRWKEEDFRVVKIEAELILEANRLQLMKQDLEKAENAYLSSFTSKKSKTRYLVLRLQLMEIKMERMITKRKVVRSKRPLELLHMDLCGPMPTESQGGNKYFLSIIDDYSRKVTVFPIRNKSDVFHTFIRFQKRAERFLSKKVIAVRTDGGLEFCNKDMDNFLTELGIKHEVTNSYTPEMNGVAERFNLTALDGIKTLLKSSEVPHKFWGEALLCFTYAWNRICHKDSNKTPFEKYSGRKPSRYCI
ncbi:retrovirus-related Pol polyprotein from transposon TNT 1-94 [Trichonephila clavipes]|nr:retrovirus-related Pol polyprotein from transposon TNT 1-94 [Trichonephila clavipes]